MFKKLKSILFTEEEIIIEEELGNAEDDIQIPDLKAVQAPKVKLEDAVQNAVPVEELQSKKEDKAPIIIQSNDEPSSSHDAGRSINITVDETIAVQKHKQRVEATRKKANDKYERKQIISPIYGGPEGSEEKTIKGSSHSKKYDGKPRGNLTNVISPMFGRVEAEAMKTKPTHAEQEALLDLDVSEMLTPERSNAEVQVSLYDYIEDLNHDKK